ncbi:MAG: hypothetical protein HYX87_03675 [Chloroflexi bacterium]|nr:hypothetical protein [Chloroflexota bacterium]
MRIYLIIGLVLVVGPMLAGFIGFLSRWSKLAPHPVESHGKVWGRRCTKCQSEDFVRVEDGTNRCKACGNIFI